MDPNPNPHPTPNPIPNSNLNPNPNPKARTKTLCAPGSATNAEVCIVRHAPDLEALVLARVPPDPCPHACVAARLKDEYWALTSGQDTECGYSGLPIREDAWKLHIPMFLRFAMGGCEEYMAGTVQTLPREPPNPFVDTPGAAFCASGTALGNRVQAWFGVVGIAVMITYLIWLKWFIQERARRKDATRLTAADYAILLTGLKHDEEIDGADGLRNKLSEDLNDLGFAPAQIDHMAFGCDGRKQIQLLRQLGVMKDNEEALAKSGDSEGLAKALEKRKPVFEEYERELKRPELSTGQAIVVFKAESDRVAFQKKLEETTGGPFFWSALNTKLPRSQPSGRFSQKLRFEAAPEPDAIIWENLELTDCRQHTVMVLGLIGVACLLSASVLIMIKLKDLAARVKAEDGSGGLAELAIVSAQVSESTDQTLLKTLLELFDTFVGVPFDNVANSLIAHMASGGFSANRIKLVISLMCAGQVVVMNLIIKAFVKVMTHLQGLDTLTEKEGALFRRLSLVLVMNTVVVPLAVEIYNTWRVSGGLAVVDASWYGPGGVISTGISLVVIDMVSTAPLHLLPPMLIMRIVSLFSRFASSYGKVLKAWEPPELLPSTSYAALITSLTLCLLYAPLYPPLYLLSAASLIFNFTCFKFGVVRWYKTPPSFDEEMAEVLRKVITRLVLPLHVGTFYLSIVNASFDPPMMPVYTAACLVLGLEVADKFVLPLIPAFQDYHQLSSSGDTTVTCETHGTSVAVNYDNVQSIAKYNIDFYAFPRLQTIDELMDIFENGCPTRVGATPTASKNVLSAVRVCKLVQEPWIDHGAGVEDDSAPPSTDLSAYYKNLRALLQIMGLNWDEAGCAVRGGAVLL